MATFTTRGDALGRRRGIFLGVTRQWILEPKPGKGKSTVRLVERNPLAAYHLRLILGLDQDLEILSENSALETPRASEIPTPIFVIDAGPLPRALATLTVVRSSFYG